ncbi:glycosyltransferase family 2 protein [Pseudaminobacter soli (ex Li et al. 2025)]|uniref:Glycosyl transferase n=1 Tax=Pseudaminobacter soli (ex Li et al. 2025) TaxID=1295366 RepID=A0A2P7RU88_9HYPH|nr:glycosyltransferase family 2 protein [Mesorhizobium soli]PSJ53785.1 glycosyl transferase [Mesorhizobium soli]
MMSFGHQYRPNIASHIMMAIPRVSVVVPTLNEAMNLPHVLPNIPAWVDEVIVVDGNSTDGTIEVAKSLLPNVVIVTQGARGKGAALRAGFDAARGDIIVTLDADASADPREISAFVGVLLSGADFVKGSRFLQGGGTLDMEWYRRLGNWGLLQLVNFRFGGKFTDLCYGYNAFWKDVLPHLRIEEASGFEIETHMNVQALRAKLKVMEVASKEFQRIHGVSNLRTIPDGWRVLKTIVKLGAGRSQPLRIGPESQGASARSRADRAVV